MALYQKGFRKYRITLLEFSLLEKKDKEKMNASKTNAYTKLYILYTCA